MPETRDQRRETMTLLFMIFMNVKQFQFQLEVTKYTDFIIISYLRFILVLCDHLARYY